MNKITDEILFDDVLWTIMKDYTFHLRKNEELFHIYQGWHLPSWWVMERYYIKWR